MISIVEESRLAHPPERLWHYFAEEVNDYYATWHREHLRWRWLTETPLVSGAAWFADEWVGRMRVQGRFIVDDVEPGRFFAYRLGFPSSLVRAGGSFRFEPTADGGSHLIQNVRIGFSIPLIGQIIDLAIGAVAQPSEIRRHMREEQANLGPLLSRLDRADAPSTASA